MLVNINDLVLQQEVVFADRLVNPSQDPISVVQCSHTRKLYVDDGTHRVYSAYQNGVQVIDADVRKCQEYGCDGDADQFGRGEFSVDNLRVE